MNETTKVGGSDPDFLKPLRSVADAGESAMTRMWDKVTALLDDEPFYGEVA